MDQRGNLSPPLSRGRCLMAKPSNPVPCWSCTRTIEAGYRVDMYLTSGDREVAGPFFQAFLCWPCFKTVSQAFGGLGKVSPHPGAMS